MNTTLLGRIPASLSARRFCLAKPNKTDQQMRASIADWLGIEDFGTVTVTACNLDRRKS